MSKRLFQRQTFVIQVINNQHATWQGTVTWVDKDETKEFRSALELIQLLDSAIDAQNDKKEENLFDATEM